MLRLLFFDKTTFAHELRNLRFGWRSLRFLRGWHAQPVLVEPIQVMHPFREISGVPIPFGLE